MKTQNFAMGIDIEDISRFSDKKYKKNKLFYHKIFTKDEIKYCLNKSNPYPHFAVRFCAKEAAIKALNGKITELKKIEVKMKNSKPTLRLPGGKRGIVSISHTKRYAIAIVIM